MWSKPLVDILGGRDATHAIVANVLATGEPGGRPARVRAPRRLRRAAAAPACAGPGYVRPTGPHCTTVFSPGVCVKVCVVVRFLLYRQPWDLITSIPYYVNT